MIGILDDVLRQADLLNSVIVPEGTARDLYDLESPATIQIDTEVGAAELIASQAAIAVSPTTRRWCGCSRRRRRRVCRLKSRAM